MSWNKGGEGRSQGTGDLGAILGVKHVPQGLAWRKQSVLECEADMEVGDGAVTASCCHSPVGRLLMSCHKACP